MQKRDGETAAGIITQVLAMPSETALAFERANCVYKQRAPAVRHGLGETFYETHIATRLCGQNETTAGGLLDRAGIQGPQQLATTLETRIEKKLLGEGLRVAHVGMGNNVFDFKQCSRVHAELRQAEAEQ